MIDDPNDLRRRAGLPLKENEEEPNYAARLRAKNYKVTPEEAAQNMHILNDTIPLRKGLDEFIHGSSSYGLTRAEREILNQALLVIKRMQVPQALLDVQTPKPNPLGAALFKKS